MPRVESAMGEGVQKDVLENIQAMVGVRPACFSFHSVQNCKSRATVSQISVPLRELVLS